MILLVTYDLKEPRDYTDLYEALKSFGRWMHYIHSTWLVVTDKSPVEVNELLRRFLGQRDLLLVVPVDASANVQGWLPREAWDWLAKQRETEMATTSPVWRNLFRAAPPSPPFRTGGPGSLQKAFAKRRDEDR